jgi:magnesium transporter
MVVEFTIDDIVDVIKDEADEDYQLAAGILTRCSIDDSIFELTMLTLCLGWFYLLGGFISLKSIGAF